ncbi:hypothetical protein EDD15DRAFT_2186733 [Pisolithus albus]|nr:hypothetical protein EDD15DRAFT_2186733 [Pisolithus albus]
MALVRPFVLVNSANVKWTETQEKSINRDYPFTNLHLESTEQYVVRTYLQFLWLPESIMPLTLLVPSLMRVQEPPSSPPGSEHPLHAMLEPLLLSTRSSSTKYHTELPQILANSGGEGEIEETTMWYALNYEKVATAEGEGERMEGSSVQGGNSEDSIMMEEKWRNTWLERLERREVQIQILLYLLKLSLPGPCRPLPPVTIPPLGTGKDEKLAKSAKRRKEKPITVIPTPAERVESFMDKLSTWQLISRMDDAHGVHGTLPRGRDWMQAFCEDVVEPQFNAMLPDMCKILRSKLFPPSPFADDDGNETDIASDLSSSPVPSSKPFKTKPLGKKKQKEHSKQDQHGSTSVSSCVAGSALRARSRSLSVSLAQDASTRRSNSGTSTTLKRALSREVSMSRTFKPRPAVALKGSEDPKVVHSQPPDPSHRLAPDARKRQRNMQGVTLVAATPTKIGSSKRRRSVGAGQRRTSSPPIFSMEPNNRDMDPFEAQDEEIWLPDNSPYSLLQPHQHSSSSSSCLDSLNNQNDDSSDIEMQTPVKKRTRL